MKLKPKRLKIVEQIIAVMILSVIVPLIITGIIINNINQQAIRRELGSSAKILAESVDNNLYDIFAANDSKLKEILVALKYIKSENARKHYLADFCEQSGIFSATEIKKSHENEVSDCEKHIIFCTFHSDRQHSLHKLSYRSLLKIFSL